MNLNMNLEMKIKVLLTARTWVDLLTKVKGEKGDHEEALESRIDKMETLAT